MATSFLARRVRGVFPFVALSVVAVVAVGTAMTVLSLATPHATPSPSPSITSATSAPPAMPSPSPTETATPLTTVTLPSSAPSVLTIYEGVHDPNRVWFVVWRYPQFRDGSTPLAGQMNQDILDEVNTRIAVFVSGPAAARQAPGKTNNLTGSYSADLVSWDLVSLTLKWVDDTVPGYTATNIETLNYELDTGDRLDLTQLFTDGQAALAILSQQSQTQLQRILGSNYDPVIVEGGTAPVAASFNNWALTSSGLKITFAESQVAPRTAGMPSVLIPWSSLTSVMQPNGPVARLAGIPALS